MMKKIALTTSVLFGWMLFFSAPQAFAATLQFSPASGTYSVRQTFSVDIIVSSSDQAVNAFSGEIQYPSDKLFAVSVSKANSIVNFWTTNPTAGSGMVSYEGIALNPGYTGSHGNIVRVTFRALSEGTATLKYKSASVLANDGLGTSVLNSTDTASYTITPAAQVEPTTPVTTSEGIPAAPVITSSTHPDQNGWYSTRVADLSWNLPSDVTGVLYTTNADPNGVPQASFGRATGRTTPALTDGVWYTHVRFRNANDLSPITHFKTQIDTVAPSAISVKELTGPDSAAKKLELSAVDALSGIAQFGIAIDGKAEAMTPSIGAATEYSTPPLARGEHSILVKAYDRAGNFVPYTASFQITRLDPPVITEYQKQLREEDFMVIRGTSYPDTEVSFSISRQLPVRETLFGKLIYIAGETPLSGTVRTDSTGAFVFAYPDRLTHGLYKIQARAVLADGTQSDPSNTIVIPVVESVLMQILHALLTPIGLVILLIILLAVAVGLFIHMFHRYRTLQIKTAMIESKASREKITG